jgi:hypothetical protein
MLDMGRYEIFFETWSYEINGYIGRASLPGENNARQLSMAITFGCL